MSEKLNILLPPKVGIYGINKIGDIQNLVFKNLVVVGANGAGKTRFGSWIEDNNLKHVHRISAQKSLNMPEFVSTKSKEIAEKDFLYGTHSSSIEWQQKDGRKINRWKNNMNTSLLDDYSQLMSLLFTEELEKCLNYKKNNTEKPITKLDRIQNIWEKVLTKRKLDINAGVINVYPNGQQDKKYICSEMSDGERVIFYLIGETLCAPKNSIIIIDEPEMHIHTSLIKRLFDLIEKERDDCSYIYLTHSIDFAISRYNATKIWVKSFEDECWDYEILSDNINIPEQLYLEVLGSRLPVIFTEGQTNSLDYAIYSEVFSDYTLKPIGSCTQVINITKAFNNQYNFHHIKAYGIIDRDRREENTIKKLVKTNIWVLDVAEVENLFLLEDIINVVAIYKGKEPIPTFEKVKRNLLDFFSSEKQKQVLLHIKDKLKKEYYKLAEFNSENIADAINEINSKYEQITLQNIFDETDKKFQQIIDSNDYDGILRVFNIKGALFQKSNLSELIEVNNQSEYHNLVINLLKKNDETSEVIRNALKAKIINS